MSRARVGAVVVVATVVVGLVPTVPAHAGSPEIHVHPVQAPIVDTFRPPAQPWAPGNRGIDYATTPGQTVHASAAGDVVFAGQVGGSLFVVVAHDDGLRTTYAFLDAIAVRRGQRVAQGDVVGLAGSGLHFGVRRGEQYLDPLSVIGARVEVRLVPHRQAARPVEAREVWALRQLAVEEGGAHAGVIRGGVAWARGAIGTAAGGVVSVLARAIDPDGSRRRVLGVGLAAVRGGLRRLALAADLVRDLHPLATLSALTGAAATWYRRRDDCTPPEVTPVPVAGRRIAVLVGGLASASGPDGAAITALDGAALGYAPGDVLQFSYRGGRVPDPDDALPGISAAPYAPADSSGDLWVAAERFRALLVDVAVMAPGVPVDVFAHSQGGVVARLGIGLLGPGEVGRPATLVTFGTPHTGAELATGLDVVDRTVGGRLLLEVAERAPGLPDIRRESPAVAQLEHGSDVMRILAEQGAPAGVHTVSIAARGDPTVPLGNSHLEGAVNVVVSLNRPDAHDTLPGSAAAHREAALALARQAPTCRTLLEHLADTVLGRHWSSMETLAALALAQLGAVAGPLPVAPTPEPAPLPGRRGGRGGRREGRGDEPPRRRSRWGRP